VSEANYVEIAGIVSQLSAADTYVRGVGAVPIPLPDSSSGEPTGEISDKARKSKAFVATEDPPSALTSLSLLPGETRNRINLHRPLYLTREQIQDPRHSDLLMRPQIEVIAARTSWLNQCRY